MKLFYIAGEDIGMGDLVSIDNNGKICRYRGEVYLLMGIPLAAFATATRNIAAGETISFSQDADTDLRSRLTAEVIGS